MQRRLLSSIFKFAPITRSIVTQSASFSTTTNIKQKMIESSAPVKDDQISSRNFELFKSKCVRDWEGQSPWQRSEFLALINNLAFNHNYRITNRTATKFLKQPEIIPSVVNAFFIVKNKLAISDKTIIDQILEMEYMQLFAFCHSIKKIHNEDTLTENDVKLLFNIKDAIDWRNFEGFLHIPSNVSSRWKFIKPFLEYSGFSFAADVISLSGCLPFEDVQFITANVDLSDLNDLKYIFNVALMDVDRKFLVENFVRHRDLIREVRQVLESHLSGTYSAYPDAGSVMTDRIRELLEKRGPQQIQEPWVYKY